MTRFSFIARMPDDPGALHRAAEIIKKYEGNINRIHYNRRIDPYTVFFELTASDEAYGMMTEDLRRIGYLQTTLATPSFLRFNVYLPHQPGALLEFLNFTTSADANIAFIDFDDKGRYPERVTISLTLDESAVADRLLTALKPRYRLEILEYDTTGESLDDTVFYVRFAQKLRPLVGETEDAFLMRLLSDINHIVQELSAIGKDHREVFSSILRTGTTLKETSGNGFYADVQRIPVTENIDLFCFQVPCGGNIFLFATPDEAFMVDTAYGIYHPDVEAMLLRYVPGVEGRLSRILVTHADADHSGGGGYYDIPAFMHRGTREIIEKANRAYGSKIEGSVLEEVYTKLINLFSKFRPPERITLFPERGEEMYSIFPVLDRLRVGDLEFLVLEGLGGHLHGQVYLVCPEYGLLFTADTVLNFDSLTRERREYNTYADLLMTSVNVDSEVARRERKALLEIAR
ncbi:MAG TPA: MBL fold metallo-hydrolase, partial [Methanomicrobiales archaeon]|nr:MBL fold metallo-hydrolase [Methanomicrobiales archaeon]